MEHVTPQEFSDSVLTLLPANVKAVAVGVSGGPDSMALAFLLGQWGQENNVRVHAITVDHGLRKESAQEAKTVGHTLAPLEIKHAILKWAGRKPKTRIMEEARTVRYRLMAAYCAKHKIKHLFLAHHRDDQAETFLFRLAKGSGLDGLSGMRAVQPYCPPTHALPPMGGGIKAGGERLFLVRPLLSIPKDNLIATCRKNKIKFIKDPSNASERFARPRLRKARKILEEEGLTSKRLFVTAQRLGRARRSLDELSEKAFKKCVSAQTKNRIVLKTKIWRNEPEEIALRVLIKAIRTLRPGEDYLPRMEKIEDLFTDLYAPVSFRKRTLGGLVFERDDRKGRLGIYHEKT